MDAGNRFDQLRTDLQVATLRGELASCDPDDYTPCEIRSICDDIEKTSDDVIQAMRDHFQTLPPEVQEAVFGVLLERKADTADALRELLGYQGH